MFFAVRRWDDDCAIDVYSSKKRKIYHHLLILKMKNQNCVKLCILHLNSFNKLTINIINEIKELLSKEFFRVFVSWKNIHRVTMEICCKDHKANTSIPTSHFNDSEILGGRLNHLLHHTFSVVFFFFGRQFLFGKTFR